MVSMAYYQFRVAKALQYDRNLQIMSSAEVFDCMDETPSGYCHTLVSESELDGMLE